jgi:hypothetical protein
MYREYEIGYDVIPAVEAVITKVKAASGLDVLLLIGDKNVSLMHPISSQHSIHLSFVEKGSFGNGFMVVDRNHIRLYTFSTEMNYLEGVTLAVLKEMDGDVDVLANLPAWTKARWAGEKWWKKVTAKPTLIKKLMERLVPAIYARNAAPVIH